MYKFEKELMFQIHRNFEDNSSFLNWVKSLKNVSKEKIQSILLNILRTNKTLIPAVIGALLASTPVMIIDDVIDKFNDSDKKEIVEILEDVDEFKFDENKFLKKLSMRESSNDWTAVNQYGYIGKYQIGYIALLDISDKLELNYFKSLKGNKKQKIKKMMNDFVKTYKSIHILELQNTKKIKKIKKLKISEEEKKRKIDSIFENEKKSKKEIIEKLSNIFSEKEQDETIKKIIKNNEHYLRRYKKYNNTVVDNVNITWTGMLAAAHLKGAKSVKEFLNSNGKTNPKDANGASVKFYLKHFEKLD